MISSIPRPIVMQNVIDTLVKNDILTKDFGLKVRKMLEISINIIHTLKDFKIGEIQEINKELKEIYEELIQFMNP